MENKDKYPILLLEVLTGKTDYCYFAKKYVLPYYEYECVNTNHKGCCRNSGI